MSTDNNDICANCDKGEEESGQLKKCGACMSVKYCSAACQKAHRPQHKKECKKRVGELHDEKLFKQPSQFEDCPICFMRMPALIETGRRYNACCGKTICCGCHHANTMTSGESLCPFCRAPVPTSDDETHERIKKRVERGNAQAIYELGCCYARGMNGLPQDWDKALELYHRAGKLGNALAYNNLGNAYVLGRGLERDEKKANYYYELAAIGGLVYARHNLGNAELRAGNVSRALKHYMIAVEGGDHESLMMVQLMYRSGCATKDDYAKALRARQAYLAEIKSDDRDKAAVYNDDNKYM